MKTLLFVDHVFHKQTRSFEFLVEILSRSFIVKKMFVDPDAVVDLNHLDLSADIVVLAQVDFLSPYYILHGKRVVVVQMFDGSAGLPEQHWILNRQARYLNFSQSLHAKVMSLGCESLLVKYAPDPQRSSKVSDFENLRCFFWNRLPNSPINTQFVGSLLKGQLHSCHIHLPRDDLEDPPANVQADFDCRVTTSNWFESRKDFEAVLDKCNIFVAPRIAEGIGHAFLDAMARGMITIAWDLPTHNEYISNWHNGILINEGIKSINLKDRTDLSRIGRMARLSIENDYRQWRLDEQKIIEFVDSCPISTAPNVPRCKTDVEKIIGSYRSGAGKYASELKRRSLTVSMMSQWDKYVLDESVNISVPRPKSLYLLFGVGNAKIFQKSGFSVPEELHTWTDKHQSKLSVPNAMIPDRQAGLRMRLRVRSIRKNRVTIGINGNPIAVLSVGRNWSDHDFALPSAYLDACDNTIIEISCDQLVAPKNGDTRRIGVAFERIEIVDGYQPIVAKSKQSLMSKWSFKAKKYLSSIYLPAR